MEVELMVTKRDDNRQPTTDDDDRVNIEQSASGRLEGRVLQYLNVTFHLSIFSRSTLIYSSSKSEIQANFSGKLDLGRRTA